MRLLVDRDGIDINAKGCVWKIPLLLAAVNGYEAVLWLLIGRDDVDINAKDHSWQTPLSLATNGGCCEAAERSAWHAGNEYKYCSSLLTYGRCRLLILILSVLRV